MRLLLIGVFLIAFLTGCWSHQPAHPRAAVVEARGTISPEMWPARDTEQVRVLLEQTPREVFEWKRKDGVDEASLNEAEKALLRPTEVVSYKAIHGRNLLRIYSKPERAKGGSPEFNFGYLFMGFEPNAFLISSRTLESDKARRELEAKLRPEPRPRPALPVKTNGEKAKVERLDLSSLYLESGLPVYIPEPGLGAVSGVVIHLQSLGANEYEPKVLDEFRWRGWVVIDLKPQSYIRSAIPEGWYSELRSLEGEYQAVSSEVYSYDSGDPVKVDAAIKAAKEHPKYARLLELESKIRKLRQGGYQVCSEADCSKVAAAIAWEIDQGMAGASYGVESILDYIDTQRPDLQHMPTVLMGFSAGALATPTAAARMEAVKPGRLSAVVVIAGGCNLLKIARESAFSDGGVRVLCGDKPVDKALGAQLNDLYLSASKLDPYHTAPLITHLPVLQVHAGSDTWVPKATGKQLYERLNYPERLVLSGDHDVLFYLLPGKARWMADWVERAVKPARAQAAGAVSEHAAP